MNKQPFYHRIDGLLFTSTTGFGEQRFIQAFTEFCKSKKAKELGIIADTVEIEYDGYLEPEAGDPSDLM
jgi:hypothetical protein